MTDTLTNGTESTTNVDTQNQESYVQKLVATKGPQWSDPEVLARGKLEADTFIGQLQTQLSELREDLSKMDYSKQLLEQLNNKAAVTTPVPNGGVPEVKTNDTQGDDINSLISKAVMDYNHTQVTTTNLEQAQKYLADTFGERAEDTLKEKAGQLGISTERMLEIAKESPNAFKQLVGGKPTVPSTKIFGTINTAAIAKDTGERTNSFYSDLRKTNPKQYYSPEVQRQKMADATRLGQDFWS